MFTVLTGPSSRFPMMDIIHCQYVSVSLCSPLCMHCLCALHYRRSTLTYSVGSCVLHFDILPAAGFTILAQPFSSFFSHGYRRLLRSLSISPLVCLPLCLHLVRARHVIEWDPCRLTKYRMCPLCPRCNTQGGKKPCQDQFGSNARPMEGSLGLCPSAGGAIEFQKQTTPHFHGNVTLSSVYQHKTLKEIRDKIETGLLSVDAIALPARLLFARWT